MEYQRNFLQSLQSGFDIGQQIKQQRDQSTLNKLASQAYSTPQADQSSLLSQMAAISPRSAQAQQQAWDGDEERRNRSMVNMAKLLTSAPEQARPQLWRSFVPTLSQYGMSELPQEYNDQTAPIITQAAQSLVGAYGGGADAELAPRVVGRALVDSRGNVLYEAPDEQDYQWSDRAGAWIPKPVAGGGAVPGGAGTAGGPSGPSRPDMEADIALANEMIAAGIPEAQIDGFLKSRGQRAQAGAQPASPLAAIPVAGIGPKVEERNAPSGYQFNADGESLSPIPGGPADKQNNPVAADLAKGEMGMRKELQDRVEKDRSVLNMYQNVQNAAQTPSAAGDLSLIFAYMKMLDPGSVVREQEFANAQNAAGVPDQVRNAWNRALSGQRLNPQQRGDFVNQARQLANSAQGRITAVTREYQGIADQYGWDPVRSTGMADFRNVQSGVQRGPAQGGGGYQVGQVINVGGKRYRVTGGDPNDPDVEEVL